MWQPPCYWDCQKRFAKITPCRCDLTPAVVPFSLFPPLSFSVHVADCESLLRCSAEETLLFMALQSLSSLRKLSAATPASAFVLCTVWIPNTKLSQQPYQHVPCLVQWECLEERAKWVCILLARACNHLYAKDAISWLSSIFNHAWIAMMLQSLPWSSLLALCFLLLMGRTYFCLVWVWLCNNLSNHRTEWDHHVWKMLTSYQLLSAHNVIQKGISCFELTPDAPQSTCSLYLLKLGYIS